MERLEVTLASVCVRALLLLQFFSSHTLHIRSIERHPFIHPNPSNLTSLTV